MKCRLCQREVERTTKHHLLPKTRHKTKRIKKKYTKQQMRHTIDVCQPCRRTIHRTFTEKELENYAELELLQEHKSIQKYLSWIRKRSNLQKIK